MILIRESNVNIYNFIINNNSLIYELIIFLVHKRFFLVSIFAPQRVSGYTAAYPAYPLRRPMIGYT